jgi:hypothetical protein
MHEFNAKPAPRNGEIVERLDEATYDTITYRDVDFRLASRHRSRALQWGVVGSLMIVLTGTYLKFDQVAEAGLTVLLAGLCSLWLYAHAKRSAYELCARQLPAGVALRWCGGVYRTLFPRGPMYMPPLRRDR